MHQFLGSFLLLVIFIFVVGICRSLFMSRKSVALIEKYAGNKHSPKLIEEIFETISKDYLLGKILQKHNATQEDISKLHKKLLQWGDFRKYNRYVPITSFFNRMTLKYLLEHKDDDARELTQKMMNHFHI